MLFDCNTGETARNFLTRVQAAGLEMLRSQHPTYSIVYAGNSLMMRQGETQSVYTYDGLTERAAKLLATLTSHAANRTIYYHTVGSDGDAVAVGVNVGTDKDYQATRIADTHAWSVQLTESVFAASPVGSGWTTTRPTASGNGVVVSNSGSSQMLVAYMVNGVTHTFNTTETIEVKQYKFRTKAEAASLVSSHTSYNASYRSYQYGSTGFYAVALTGTIETAVSRYVDGDAQYTVDVTLRTLGGAWS